MLSGHSKRLSIRPCDGCRHFPGPTLDRWTSCPRSTPSTALWGLPDRFSVPSPPLFAAGGAAHPSPGLSGPSRGSLSASPRGGESLPAFRSAVRTPFPPELGGQSKLRLTASLYPAGEVRGYPGGDALKLFRLVGYGSGRRNAGLVCGDCHGALSGHCVFVDFFAAYVNALCLRPRKL